MDKPTKPSNLMPRTFGGVKNNFSADLQSTGYEDGVPAIYGGDNLNYQLNATGQELNYCETICDYINALPIGKTITTDANNKLIYTDFQTVPEERWHAAKSYLDEGEVLTDTEGYADVLQMYHSSFDLSKFVVTGTPTIGANGVLAGIVSGTDYVKTPSITAGTTSLEIFWKGTFYTSSNTLWGGVGAFSCGILNNNSVRVYNGGEAGSFDRTIGGTLNNDDSLEVYFKLTTTDRLLRVTSKHGTYESTSTGTYTLPGTSAYGVGSLTAGTYPWLGSVDLKYFKIKVDGVTVFSGNETETDTLTINGLSVQIPYVISKTGAKIAEASSRTALGNLYEQDGFADYYTIDEENKTFTLPMGDIAGLRAQKENTANKVNKLNTSQTDYPSCYAVSQALSGTGDLTPYCANSGNVDANGEADIVATTSTETTIPYSQPILTENGTAGTSALAVQWMYNGGTNTYVEAYNNSSSYPYQKPYRFFDGDNTEITYVDLSIVNQIKMVFKDAVCLTKIQQLNISGGTYHYFTGTVNASNDGLNWTTVHTFTKTYVDANNVLTLNFATNTTAYAYYVLEYTTSNWTKGGAPCLPITELSLTGSVTAGTAGTQVLYKIGGNYPDLVLSDKAGDKIERASIATIDISSLANGTYNVFIDKTSEEYLANTIYRQNAEPSTPSTGDVWVNTSVEPLRVYKYTGSLWDAFDKIPIGSFTVSSGAVTGVRTFPYNVNGTCNKLIEGYAANKGQNNYIVEWRYNPYDHNFHKFAIQNGESNTVDLAFYQAYKDSDSYNLVLTKGRGITANSYISFKAKAANGVTVMQSDTNGYYSWHAEGWMN